MTKILLIDDDPDIRTVMSMVLHKKGFEVATTGKREDVFAMVEANRPAVILMDVLLAGDDGRQICRELKATESTRTIPIIMFSGHPGAAQNYQSWGADDFITKPIDVDTLLAKLHKQIEVTP